MMFEHPGHIYCMAISNLAEITLSAFYVTGVLLPSSHGTAQPLTSLDPTKFEIFSE
jgi:hypothetical protein